jgi:hypothetical protein
MISSGVIDHLEAKNGSHVLFHYFDASEVHPPRRHEIVAALLRQLFQGSMKLPVAVGEAFSKQSDLNLDDLQSLMKISLRECEKTAVYLVLDGLDECDDQPTRTWAISFLQELCELPHFRMISWCRKFYDDINSCFDSHAQINISASPEDLRRYINSRLDERWRVGKIEEAFKSRIVDTIVTKSNGL